MKYFTRHIVRLKSAISTLTDLSFSAIPYLLVFRLSSRPEVYSDFAIALIVPAFAYAISDAGFSLLTPVYMGRVSVVLPQTRLKLIALIQVLLYLTGFLFLEIFHWLFLKSTFMTSWWLYFCFLLYLVPVLLSGWYLNYIFSGIIGPIFILIVRVMAAACIGLSPVLPSVTLFYLILTLLIPGIFIFFFALRDFSNNLPIYQQAVSELIPLFSTYSSLKSIAFGMYSVFPILISAKSPELVPLFVYLDKTKSLYSIPFSFFGQISYWAYSKSRFPRFSFVYILISVNLVFGVFILVSIPYIFQFLPRYIAESIDSLQFRLFILAAIFSVSNSLLLFKGFIDVHPARLSLGLAAQSLFFLIAYLCYRSSFTWISSVVCLSEFIMLAISVLVIKNIQSSPIGNVTA